MTRILIVEDSPTQAEQLRFILEEAKFDVEVAGDAETALTQLSESSFDMVISDVEMPGISGYELCKKIKAEPAWKTIPVILLTTHKDPKDIFRGLECGADNFHTKPYDPQRLIERIRNILYNKTLRTEGKLKVGVEVEFLGQRFVVGSDKEQILDLLISTFEDIVQSNLDLERSQNELKAAHAKIEGYARVLEERNIKMEARHRQIIEQVTDGIIVIDERGAIDTYNPSAQRIFGYTPEEVVGQNVKVLMPGRYRNQHDNYLANYSTSRVGAVIGRGMREVEGRRKDETVFPLQVSLSEAILDDRFMFIGVVRDLTDQKEWEQQAAAAEGARQANIAKSEFLSSISHEIRTPLNGVIGNLELLAKTRLGDDQEELLHDADRAAKSLLELIGNILDFSKIEAGKLSIERVEMKPAAIVREAVNIIQSRARQNGIFVTSSVVADVPEIVVGDPARLRQILLNLIGNAVKFTAAGGVHLRLEVDKQGAGSDRLTFAVHDSGKGFDNTKAASLFEAFTQNYKVSTENFEGTGLGLSICKSLVETMGGKIGCEGVPGEGASFFFTLLAPTIAVASATVPPYISGRYVLLINVARDEVPEELLTYFAARGAIIRTTGVEKATAVAEHLLAEAKSIDLAIYVPKSDEPPPSDMVAALRKKRTVTMVYTRDSSAAAWRRNLKAGVAYLLVRDLVPACLDQNLFDITGLGGRGRRRVTPDQLPNHMGRVILEGKRILVLEDRVVNQTVITKQLRNFGIVPTIAGNGLLGLKAIEEGSYDLIFCDCSMPQMDGYEFTRTLRKREASSGSFRTPVVAMTANAFREDMEKCLAAGMDDFVSKPVTLDRMGAVLAKWLRGEGDEVDHRSSSDGGSDAIDVTVLRDLVGTEDRTTMNDILTEFVAAANESWNEIEAKAAEIDGVALSKLAHGAKGEARSAGAVKLGELYAELERVSKLDDRDNIAKLLAQIPEQVERVERFITKYAEEERGGLRASGQKADAEPAIDVNALAELIGEEDVDAFAKILQHLAPVARAAYDEVAACVGRADVHGLRKAAHAAKGEAHSAAAKRLGDLYAEIEARAKANDAAGAAALMAEICTEVERVEAFIKDYDGVGDE